MISKEIARLKIYTDWVESTENTLKVEIIDVIIEDAYEYWERANNVDDFCIQSLGLGVIVFGGFNRVQWSVKNGFRIDKNYCTSNFLEANKNEK